MFLSELISKGGPTMYFLLIMSVVSWCIVIERVIVLAYFKKKTKALGSSLKNALQKDGIQSAQQVLNSEKEMVSHAFEGIFDESARSKEDFEISVSNRINATILKLKRSMWVLATIGTIAPFIGLFGTVTGIMNSFEAIAESGKAGFSVVSAGLSEALLTTAVGIVIAVITVCFFNYLHNKISSIVAQMREDLEFLISVRLRARS